MVTKVVVELVVVDDAGIDESDSAMFEPAVPQAATTETKAAKNADLRSKITHTYPMDDLP